MAPQPVASRRTKNHRISHQVTPEWQGAIDLCSGARAILDGMRVVGIVLALAVATYGALWLYHSLRSPPATKQRALQQSALKHEECRDLCEQTQIVEKLDDEYVRNCRARCDAQAKKERDDHYEPIERITVAPADHRPEAPAK
jgi:hypothetical protein